MVVANFTDLIQKSQPHRRLTKITIFILVACGLLVWSLIIDPGTERGRLVPLLLICVVSTSVFLSIVINAARRQGLAKWSRQASDLCLLEQWSEAIGPLQRLLSKPVPLAQIRYQGLLELAGVAEHTGRISQASEIYQAIAQEQPRGLLASLALVGNAIALLKLDRLADADSIIRRLEVSAEGPSLKSLVLLARLYQQIRTGHYAEALEEESSKCEVARVGLSTRAAYVYALLALTHRRQAKALASPEPSEQCLVEDQIIAQRNWQKATMLMKPYNLVEKFQELAELDGACTSAPSLPGPPETSAGSADEQTGQPTDKTP